MVIGISRVCKTGFGIRCGFLRPLRDLRVIAAFEQVFVWVASYKDLQVAPSYLMDQSRCGYFDPFSVARCIAEENYANFGIVSVGLL